MKLRSLGIRSLGTVLIAAASFALPTLAQNAPKIAVANPSSILMNLQETKDMQARLDQEKKTLGNIELDKRAKIKDLTSARDALKPDAPQYAEKNKELQAAQVDLEVWGRIMQADGQRSFKQQLRTLYDKVTAGIAEVAAEKHIDLVLAEIKPEIPENLDQINPDQLRALMTQRNILFVASQLDITNDVISAMDAKYTKK
jgi:Skp family chaperone for outer membrane proteins